MKKDILTFLAGVVVGAILGILVDDERKEKVQQLLAQQAKKIKDYENPIKEGADKVKKFVKEHWA